MLRPRWFAALAICCACNETPPSPHAPGETTSAETGDSSSSSSSGSSTSADSSSSEAHADATPPGHTDTSGTSTSADDPLCGDGHVDPGEQCDNGYTGNDDTAACLVDCTLAVCGDGHVFAGKEECDDANLVPEDGCHQCYRTRKVFVTSDTYRADQFMGLVGVDQRCRSLAAQADLPNFSSFKAWISDSTTSPGQRMFRGRGRYELVNGLLVADNWDDLLLNGPENPIVVDENSLTHETPVWTGTNPDGTPAHGSDHCADWTSQNFGHAGFVGASTEISPSWTLIDSPLNPVTDCGIPSALYCFEQQ